MVNCSSVLGQGGFWVVNKKIAKKTSLDAAIVIADLISKREYFIINKDITLESGWFFNTQENIEIDTGLSPHEQRKAINELVAAGFLEVKKIGIPAKNHFKVNDSQLLKFLTTSDEYFSQQDIENFNDIYNNNKEKNKRKKTNLLIGEKREEDPNFKNLDFKNKEIKSIEEREFLKPKNKKEKRNPPCPSTPLSAVSEFASEIVAVWNEFNISKQLTVPNTYLSKIETLFVNEGVTISEYKKAVSNMKLSGYFEKEGRSLNFLTTLDENYFYRFLNWMPPKKQAPMYKSISFD